MNKKDVELVCKLGPELAYRQFFDGQNYYMYYVAYCASTPSRLSTVPEHVHIVRLPKPIKINRLNCIKPEC